MLNRFAETLKCERLAVVFTGEKENVAGRIQHPLNLFLANMRPLFGKPLKPAIVQPAVVVVVA